MTPSPLRLGRALPGFCRMLVGLCLFGQTARGEFPAGLPVSPFLTGQNFWLNPPDSAYPIIGASGVKLMRIGGKAYDDTPLSDAALLKQVDNIRAIGAEPLIQVSRHKGAAVAAATVTFLNVTHGRSVKYWSIGNEPDMDWSGTEAALATYVAGYTKTIAVAMRDADPSIMIGAADMAFYSPVKFEALLGGAADITSKDPKGRYYVDGINFHRYPFSNVITRSAVLAEMHGAFESRVGALVSRIAYANAQSGRTGAAALTWGLTEFNLTYLPSTSSGPNLAVVSTSATSREQLAVMLLNEETTGQQAFTLRMNDEPVLGAGARINISAGLAREFSGTIENQSTAVLIFDPTGALQQRVIYSLARNRLNLPPLVETFPVFTRAPAAPTQLNATAGDTEVKLRWAAGAATGFNVKRAPAGSSIFILRDYWGFRGYTMSDWGGFSDTELAMAAELDFCEGNELYFKDLPGLVASGRITTAQLDHAVSNVLRTKILSGMMDGQPAVAPEVRDSPEHRELVYESGLKSIVLLKNQDAILPLSPMLKTLALIGPNAANLQLDGHSSSAVIPPYTITLKQGLETMLGAAHVRYAKGCEMNGTSQEGFAAALEIARGAEVVIFAGGLDNTVEGEEYFIKGVGYRWFDQQKLKPEFAFGSGLSYTKFEYRNLRVMPDRASAGQEIVVQVDVANTGQRAGEEVVQLYVSADDILPAMAMPVKQLKGFAKITIPTGGSRTVTFRRGPDELYIFDPAVGRYRVPIGSYHIGVGGSSDQLPLSALFTLTPADELPDLTVTNIRSIPAFPLPGDRVQFVASVLNRGTGPSPADKDLRVSFRVGDEIVSWSPAVQQSSSSARSTISAGKVSPITTLTRPTTEAANSTSLRAIKRPMRARMDFRQTQSLSISTASSRRPAGCPSPLPTTTSGTSRRSARFSFPLPACSSSPSVTARGTTSPILNSSPSIRPHWHTLILEVFCLIPNQLN